MGLSATREDGPYKETVHPIRIHTTFHSPTATQVGALVSVDVPFFVCVPKSFVKEGLRGAVLEEIADQIRDALVKEMRLLYDA